MDAHLVFGMVMCSMEKEIFFFHAAHYHSENQVCIHALTKVNLRFIMGDLICAILFVGLSHAKMLLQESVIHY